MTDEKKNNFFSHHPFAPLRDRLQDLPQGPAQREEAPRGPSRAVVRLERKGRGGKEVTVVEQLGLGEKELGAWLKALKNALGCGGAAAGGTLVLQGDQRQRLPAILAARGVRKVISG